MKPEGRHSRIWVSSESVNTVHRYSKNSSSSSREAKSSLREEAPLAVASSRRGFFGIGPCS
ncbi:hypothetical protein CCACVL1_11121 [Corchorus capsularis]|uniref:Uncharacterized protein n=1 Tax=Corchorus capsularis TaxID=210143 RepID=A0A1R3IMR1_COCAP|nr:hypothetical protein CCACVL1_11121 [Corchorus capsularis]